MSDTFTCPECQHEHAIAELELWQVYEADGKETEINCNGCDADLIITSTVDSWSFGCEVNE